MLRYIVPMLILTGARKREVLDARWEDFDEARKVWRIPMTKTGKPRHVPLSDGGIRLLHTVPRLLAATNAAVDAAGIEFLPAPLPILPLNNPEILS
jgi:integrase